MRAQEFERTVECNGVFKAEVDKEDVLPWAALHWAGFNLGEVEAGGAECLQRAEECAGAVLEREGDAELVGVGRCRCGGGHKGEEAGEVVGMVLNTRDEHFGTVLGGRESRGDPGGIAQTFGHQVFNAAGGVVERNRRDVGVGSQPAAALRESDRVRENLADVCELDARGGDDVVTDAKERFPGGDQIVRQEQIKVLGDRAVEAVLDGQHAEVDHAGLHGFTGLGGEGAGHDIDGQTGVLGSHGV